MNHPQIEEFYSDPALVSLQLGDVILFSGRNHITQNISGGGARIVPVTKRKQGFTDSTTGKLVAFECNGNKHNISARVCRSVLVARLGEQGLKDFRNGTLAPLPGADNETKGLGDEEDMVKKKQVEKRKPRGGLAATAEATGNAAVPRAKKAKAPKAEGKGSAKRARATDIEVTAFIKAHLAGNPEASDQNIVDALRATGLGCSLARLATLKAAK